MPFRFITSRTDSALFAVCDIYQKSFPLREQMLVSWIWKQVAAVEAGNPAPRLMVAETGDGIVQGFALFEMGTPPSKPGYLGYLAVDENARGNKVGEQLYQFVANSFFAAGTPAFVFEIEDAEEVHTFAGAEAAALAIRRREWYRRMGARALTGVRYASATNWQAPVSYVPMIHSVNPSCTPEQAHRWAQDALSGDGSRWEATGTPGLD